MSGMSGKRISRSAGSSRNKTRIEKILAEQSKVSGAPPRGRGKRATGGGLKESLVSSLVPGSGADVNATPSFFGSSALADRKTQKRTTKRRPGDKPRGSKNTGRPRSEEPRARPSRKGSGARRVPFTVSRFDGGKDDAPRGRKSRLPRALEAKARKRANASHRARAARAAAKADKALEIADETIAAPLPERRDEAAISAIEQMQAQRRADLESYLLNLATKTDSAGKPLFAELAGDAQEDADQDQDDDMPAAPPMPESEPVDIKRLLKRVEREFLASYPEYTGVIKLKDGTKLNPLTKIGDFAAEIDALLSRVGEADSMGGTGLGFQMDTSEQRGLDKLDVKLSKLRAMRPRTQTAEISDKARRFLHDLRVAMRRERDTNSDGTAAASSSIIGTDHTLLNEVSRSVVRLERAWEGESKPQVNRTQIAKLVEQGRRELGGVFLTEGAGDDVGFSTGAAARPARSAAAEAPNSLDEEELREYGGMKGIMMAMRRKDEMKEYFPEKDLRHRPIDSELSFLDASMRTLADADAARKAIAQAHAAPESHRKALEESKALPPVRTGRVPVPQPARDSVPAALGKPVQASRVAPAQAPPKPKPYVGGALGAELVGRPEDLVSKAKTLLGSVGAKYKQLKALEKYDL